MSLSPHPTPAPTGAVSGAGAAAGPTSQASSFPASSFPASSFPAMESFGSFCGGGGAGARGGRWGAATDAAAPAGAFENSVLDKMRRREAERAALVAEMEREEQE